MATFTVILENESKPNRGGRYTFWDPPTFHATEVIEAENLDDAWNKARAKWYIQKFGGRSIQIADIKKGEWSPPEEPEIKESTNGKEENGN